MTDEIDALLFDLGRVVIDIDIARTLKTWADHAGAAPDDIATRFAPINTSILVGNSGELVNETNFDDILFKPGWEWCNMRPIRPPFASSPKQLPFHSMHGTSCWSGAFAHQVLS